MNDDIQLKQRKGFHLSTSSKIFTTPREKKEDVEVTEEKGRKRKRKRKRKKEKKGD